MTKLNNLNPCSEAKEWVKQFNTFQEAWQSCDCVDWMLWLLNKLKLPTDQLARQFAYHVLHIYEERYPDDKRPRAALENPTRENIAAAEAAQGAQAAQGAAVWAAAEAATWAARAVAEGDAEGAAWTTRAAVQATWAAAQAAAEGAAEAAWADERRWQCDQIRIMYPILDVEL